MSRHNSDGVLAKQRGERARRADEGVRSVARAERRVARRPRASRGQPRRGGARAARRASVTTRYLAPLQTCPPATEHLKETLLKLLKYCSCSVCC